MIPEYNPIELTAVNALLTQEGTVAITTHHKPDGDAIGSCVALYHYLCDRNKECCIILPSDFPDFLSWMVEGTNYINYEENPQVGNNLFAKASIIFCLDFNDAKRVERLENHLLKSGATKIMIDHHLEPTDFCDYTFSFYKAGSTAELVYHFILALDATYKFSKKSASSLYAGIMTDTGSFRFSSTTGDTHRLVASLLDCGVIPNEIHEAIFDNFSENRTHFLGHCLKDKMVVLPEYKTAYIAISKSELKQYDHQTGDTEGIVNFALSIKGVRMAAFICEHEGIIKISFRSRGHFSVKELAATHFNGGGHQNAAGGRSFETLDNTVSKFLTILPSYLHQLNSNV
ncbi:MAG: DHH family phosphoesterase [Bacteroidetes bacterium]|nr:DHH family phosphoesterase [Bacteroidota bacterium]